jgi:hypothetical protein
MFYFAKKEPQGMKPRKYDHRGPRNNILPSFRFQAWASWYCQHCLIAGVVDTGEKFIGGVVDTGEKFIGGVVDNIILDFLVISDCYQRHRGTILSPVSSLTVVTTEVCSFCKTTNGLARTRMPQ